MMYGTIKKDKDKFQFEWPESGHRMTIYMNVYHNVPVSHELFYEHLLACYQGLAEQVKEKLAKLKPEEPVGTQITRKED